MQELNTVAYCNYNILKLWLHQIFHVMIQFVEFRFK